MGKTVIENLCPKCGKELNFGSAEVSENTVNWPVDCPECDFKGTEEYSLKFELYIDSAGNEYR